MNTPETDTGVLFCPDALVNEAGAIFHFDLLLLGSPRTLAHFLRLFLRHHFFGCGGLHWSCADAACANNATPKDNCVRSVRFRWRKPHQLMPRPFLTPAN